MRRHSVPLSSVTATHNTSSYMMDMPSLNSDSIDATRQALDEAYAKIALYEQSGRLVEYATFRFRTLEEGRALAVWLAYCYPDHARATYGMHELFTNAVEHGNLEIGYALKSILLEEDRWEEEIAHRLQDVCYAHRYVEVQFHRDVEGLHLSIIDQGSGFSWSEYLVMDPNRADDLHGRGIATVAMMSFDKLTYHGSGNHVYAFVRSET